MNSVYVILDTHTDLALNDLLTVNIAWIKENFSIFLMESVPNNLTDQAAVDYAFQVINRGIDSEDCVKIGVISREEGDFLKNAYRNDMTPEAFINKRLMLITKMLSVSADKEIWARFLGALKRCELYFRCLNEGIPLRGLERPDYKPLLFTNSSSRDISMIETIMSTVNSSQSKPVLAITGASHGINLIANLCRIGQYSCHFIRLVTDAGYIRPDTPFEQFKINILSK